MLDSSIPALFYSHNITQHPEMDAEQFAIDSYVMGYHDYKSIWTPHEDDFLPCGMEPDIWINIH